MALARDARIAVEAQRLERAEQALIETMRELGREQADIDERLEALRSRYKPEEQ